MDTTSHIQDITLLFDEHGTPTFRSDRETEFFLGVCVTYDQSSENSIFYACEKIFGLSNKRPLKNSRISNSRAIAIAKTIVSQHVQILITAIDLSNDELQNVVRLYEECGNFMRRIHRNVRERSYSHVLHTQILDDCLYNSITKYVERIRLSSRCSIYIDNWAIPESDVEISLEDRSRSLETKINEVYAELKTNLRVNINPISLMSEDCSKKRFIDVIASSISRSFLQHSSDRYSPLPLRTILAHNTNRLLNITDSTISFLRDFMDQFLRESN